MWRQSSRKIRFVVGFECLSQSYICQAEYLSSLSEIIRSFCPSLSLSYPPTVTGSVLCGDSDYFRYRQILQPSYWCFIVWKCFYNIHCKYDAFKTFNYEHFSRDFRAPGYFVDPFDLFHLAFILYSPKQWIFENFS